MKSIDLQLNELIIKWGIDECCPAFKRCWKAAGLVKALFHSEQFRGKTMAVGTKTDVQMLRQEISASSHITTVEIKSCTATDVVTALSVYDSTGFDTIAVLTRVEAEEIRQEFKNCKAHVIFLYDYFEENGLQFEAPYYDLFSRIYYDTKGLKTTEYEWIDLNRIFYEDRIKYEKAEGDNTIQQNVKRLLLEQVIFDCVYVRDFLTMKHYIQQYLASGFDLSERYTHFLLEVDQLLREIRNAVLNRNDKDVIMFWLDALEYGDDHDMAFLSGLDEKAVVFENLYTVTPYTHSTAKTLFCKKRVVDDKSFLIETIKEETSGIIHDYMKKGYCFRYFGALKGMDQTIRSKWFFQASTPVSLTYWRACDELMQSERPSFMVLHVLSQTHTPFVSLGLEGEDYIGHHYVVGEDPEMQMLREKQRVPSRIYTDKQLAFYQDFFPPKSFKIFMSDHGHTPTGRFHPIFKVVDEKLEPKKIEGLYSYYDFDLILKALKEQDMEALDSLQRNDVPIQDIDFYSGSFIKSHLDVGQVDGLFGYRGVINLDEIYLRMNDGRRFYLQKKGKSFPIYDEHLSQLEVLAGNERIDVLNEPVAKYSQYIYKVLERYRLRMGEWEEKMRRALKDLVDDIPKEKVIALRGGGNHTAELLLLWEDSQRSRIRYIIDQNDDCIAARMGMNVIGYDEIQKCNIDCILLSSKQNGLIWKGQLQEDFPEIEVIDPYQYLEEKEILCEREFYVRNYVKSDFDIGFPNDIGD